MKVQTGYLYHIKDEFFDKINNKGLMINHENGHSRPSYLAIKVEKEIINDFEYMLSLKSRGLNIFFTDIDYIKNLMLEELK